ncbi:hypothetical protein BC835DRAFT_1079208 [Cytidiella melzeri]|nr:hypothetical protein BC835DRAFT_1079208 [Cytidiella melzeri]
MHRQTGNRCTGRTLFLLNVVLQVDSVFLALSLTIALSMHAQGEAGIGVTCAATSERRSLRLMLYEAELGACELTVWRDGSAPQIRHRLAYDCSW